MTSTSDDHLLLHALADRELDAAASLALEKRMAAEPALAAEYERINALKLALDGLEKPAVSAAFYDRMAALASPEKSSSDSDARPRATWQMTDWRATAASLVFTACLASGATYLVTAPTATGSIEEAVIGGHRRSLLAASPIDVASSDRHTVRPWFDAKLGVAPPTTDLSGAGFLLLGGRVDVVGGKAVPSLVYRHGPHLISVVAIPAGAGETTADTPRAETSGGFNVVRWSQSGFHYWAVSDLDASELDVFVKDLRTK